MTSQAVTQDAIEEALIARFSGVQVEIEGTLTDVEVFLEEPAVEETTERIYPSISLMYLGEVPNFDIRDTDDEEREEVGYNQTPPVYIRTMRQNPEPTKMRYSVDVYNRVRAQTSRDLLYRAIRKKVKHRDYLTVENVDGEDVTIWMFWTGGIAPLNEVYPDMVVYHHSMTIEVLPYLAIVDNSETEDEKVAMNINWKVSSKEVNEDTGDFEDVEIRITEDGAEPI